MAGIDDIRLRPGGVLAGKYRIERVLGAGGMGIVMAARHLQLEELVAIKCLLPGSDATPGAIARFIQEARAAAKVKSDHVARVIDVGQLETGTPYMVMEYLEGYDLAALLTRGPLPIAKAVDFVLHACEALAEAHHLGIVHRDLKPANLFCVERAGGRPWIKVLDFGISKVLTAGAQGHDMTQTSALMGSPLYMSPEQMQLTKGVDARTDIWSLGVILFELIAGRPPFVSVAVADLAIKVATESPPSLRLLRGDVPPSLEPVILRCLEKDRTKRFQTVAELVIALRDFGSSDGRNETEHLVGASEAASSPSRASGDAVGGERPTDATLLERPPQTGAAWGGTRGGRKGSKKTVAVGVVMGAAAATLAIVVLGTSLLSRRKAGVTTATTTMVAGSGLASSASEPPTSREPGNSQGVPPILDAGPIASATGASPSATASGPDITVVTKERLRAVTQRAGSSGAPPQGRTGARPSASSPAPAPPAASASAMLPKARPNCDPPYVIDAAGDRQYKPECL